MRLDVSQREPRLWRAFLVIGWLDGASLARSAHPPARPAIAFVFPYDLDWHELLGFLKRKYAHGFLDWHLVFSCGWNASDALLAQRWRSARD